MTNPQIQKSQITNPQSEITEINPEIIKVNYLETIHNPQEQTIIGGSTLKLQHL